MDWEEHAKERNVLKELTRTMNYISQYLQLRRRTTKPPEYVRQQTNFCSTINRAY